MNYAEMPAGREMDALVAEKVMGWRAWAERRGDYTYIVFQLPGEREPFAKYRNPEAERARYAPIAFADIDEMKHVVCDIPRYSTEIAAAWEVVSALGERAPFPQYLEVANRYSDAAWIAKVFEGGVMVAEAYADTAPLAICRAALAAVAEP